MTHNQRVMRPTPVVGRQFLTTVAYRIPAFQPTLFSTGIQFLLGLKYVMKKMAMIAVGISLFVAGYHHIHRQNDYVTAQAALSSPSYVVKPMQVTQEMKNTIAFRLANPS